MNQLQKFLKQLIPFLFLGVAVVAFVFGILLLAYLFLFGALVGLILFTISWIRAKFFPSKTLVSKNKNRGRIIDSDDWHREG